ncbi:hypothetical protein N5D52_18050 [Pseudomonas sp. GD03860]|uniref:hypothetical protein n=1 Tax=Pseudomonas TaxID=286 RepID=UPI002363BBDE|nr:MULTISPECIES: hypothetical protein [Pseudomonas]MDD2056455.1 hypothetical protein [Pseudomonas putida]MDH0638846.1 hypothetical protein [Pseudomonas sp. GD03860]
MKTTIIAAAVTTTLAGFVPVLTMAATTTDPVLGVGLIGSYSELEFKGRTSTDTEYIPEGGLFINFGNKLTAHTGLVYQAELSGQYVERQGERVKDAQADVDLGWRVALDDSNFIDALIGAGYKWNRFHPDYSKYDIELTSRTPFAKVAIGYNHQFDNATVRLEAGVRKTIDGDSRLEISRVGSDTLDLKDTSNPYAELHVLFNQQGDFPVVATLYYSHFKYDLDGQFLITNFDKQTRNEYGAKLGLVF